MSSEASTEILSDFGLTRDQAKIYITVAKLGLASVSQISRISKVRREDVYRVLPKLEKMGLVEKILGTPIRIRALPVKEALSILIKREQKMAEQRISVLKGKSEEFLRDFKTTGPLSKLEGEEANFALVSQREAIMSKVQSMLNEAKKEIDIRCSRTKLVQFVQTFAEQLKKITKRGVRIRIVSDIPELDYYIPRIIEEYVMPGSLVDLRYTNLASGHYTIADFKQALIATTIEGNFADNPCLWTDNDSLMGLLQGNFENLWRDSIRWEAVETKAVGEKVTRFIEQLRPASHVIFVYDSVIAKYNVLFNYLKIGLENGEATVYVASEENPEQIEEAMKEFGIDLDRYKRNSALSILRYDDVYITDGKFDLDATIDFWNKLYKEALKKGFKGLRVTGEMACFFKHNLIQELIEYERALHRTLDIPIIAICAYNARTINKTNDPTNLYNELIKAHGTVLFAGIDNKLGKIEIRKE